ncbi:MAG: budZ [Glaciihabitans sp.]|nr:budZ [Glaciihabitans sp.]
MIAAKRIVESSLSTSHKPQTERQKVQPKSVIVTGAGAGLGKGIAERLAADGFDVAVTDIDAQAAEGVAEDLRARGLGARAYALDVSDPEQVDSVVERVIASQPQLYGLVNNAGIGRATAFLDISKKDWDRITAVNTTGPFLMSQAVIKELIKHHEGSIVNLSSIAGKDGFPHWVHYGVTKHAVIGLTRGLAREFGGEGIRVNAICPGAVKTAIWGAEAQGTDDPDALFASLASRTALGRGQSVEDIAAATSFLIGNEAINITGISLSVDSGLLFS